jgi:exosortase/archaeosortase family protein
MTARGLPEPVRATLFYALLFVTIAWGFELVPSAWLEKFTAETTSGLLGVLGFSSSHGVENGFAYLSLVEGVRDVSVTIIRGCTAIHVWGILAALILPLKRGSWRRKVAGLVFGIALLFVMNISRVFLTVYLTAYDVPPFSWLVSNPTVETYHMPLSFIYGVIGVAIIIVSISKWFLPELADTLIRLPEGFKLLFVKGEG